MVKRCSFWNDPKSMKSDSKSGVSSCSMLMTRSTNMFTISLSSFTSARKSSKDFASSSDFFVITNLLALKYIFQSG